jgi:hypothetical protein
MVDTTGDVMLTVTNPDHPIFAGIELVDGTMVNPFAEGAVPLPTDPTIISRGISINNNTIDDEGTVLATIAEVSADTGPVGGVVIAEFPAGATMENSSGSPEDVLGGPRLIFLTGSREPDGVTGGQAAALYDLYEDGGLMFLNAVDYMLNPPPPPYVNLATNGGFEDGVLDPWWLYDNLGGGASSQVVSDDVAEGSSSLHIVIPSVNENFWDVGLGTGVGTLYAGKAYTLSAFLKSAADGQQAALNIELGQDPWTKYAVDTVTMTTEWAEYSVTTDVLAEDVNPVNLTFHIGYAPGEIWVDGVRIYEGEYVAP